MDTINVKDWLTNHSSHVIPSIIQAILPADIGEYILISGKTGIGKSVLALHLAFCLATGTPFYGYKTNKIVVSYIAMEGGQADWRDRMKKIQPQYPDTDNLNFQIAQPIDLLNKNKRDELKGACKGCEAVILDNLRQVTSGKYLDPNYAAEWLKVYQQFLKDVNSVGILTHHIKKKDSRYLIEPDDVYQLKGATEYVDASTTVILLERRRHQKDSATGKFKPSSNDDLAMYFAKSRIASEVLKPINLVRNYDKCSLDIEVIREVTG